MFEKLPAHPNANKNHWADRGGSKFINPWNSFKPHAVSKWGALKIAAIHPKRIPVPKNIHEIYRVVKPTWKNYQVSTGEEHCRAHWIGHATWILELPKQQASHTRGIRILFDPVFSEYTSPARAAKLGLGPKRYSKLPCTVDEIPEVDIVVISHNHYDHLDMVSIAALEEKTNRTMQYVVPKNNRKTFMEFGIQAANIVEMDWWDCVKVVVPVNEISRAGSQSSKSVQSDYVRNETATFVMHCLPSQHTSARSIWDTDQGLWASWMVQTPRTESALPKTVYFAGDTGYRYTDSEDYAGDGTQSMPTNPVFKQIGEVFGPLDFAMIPIGLYSPRFFMSNVHCCPEDSVEVHIDIKSKKSVGMHFGTFRGGLSRNFEDVEEPPQRLRKWAKHRGLDEEEFITIDIGGELTSLLYRAVTNYIGHVDV